jgi:hypothetical protein
MSHNYTVFDEDSIIERMHHHLRAVRDTETELAIRDLSQNSTPEERATLLIKAGLPADAIVHSQEGNQRTNLINDISTGILTLISEGRKSLQESMTFITESRPAEYYGPISHDPIVLDGTPLVDLFATDALGALALIEFEVGPQA